MKAHEIIQDIYYNFEEQLEMMSGEEKFIFLVNVLSQKLSEEMTWKEHYKTCWYESMKPSTYKGINS
jgi:hypothetical protein